MQLVLISLDVIVDGNVVYEADWFPIQNFGNAAERLGTGIETDGITTLVLNTSAYFFKKTVDLIDFKVLFFGLLKDLFSSWHNEWINVSYWCG